MKLAEFQEAMSSRGFKAVGKAAYGQHDGYPAAVNYIANKQLQIIMFTNASDGKSLSKALKSGDGQKFNFICNKGTISVNFVVWKNNMEIMDSLLSHITATLREGGISAPSTCPQCGQGGCDALVAHQGGYHPAHQECLTRMAEAVKEKAEQETNNGSYLTGFIGAFLGAIVGIIPSIISIMWVNTIYAILFALIPLCIYKGYTLFKGKRTKACIGINIVLSIISVYLMEIILLCIDIVREFVMDIPDAIALTFSFLGDGETWSLMTQDSISSFIFIALGIWIAWSSISKTADADVKEVENILETVTPLETASAAADGVESSN